MVCLWSAVLATGLPRPSAAGPEVTLYAGDFDTEAGLGDGPFETGVVVRLTGTPILRLKKTGMVLVPAFGAVTTDRNSLYAWAGGSLYIPLSRSWGLVPETGAGVYRRGDAKNLGGTLEFRSGLEVACRVGEKLRLGLEFYHLSNAGIYHLNPGVNSLVLTVGIGRAPLFRSRPPSNGSSVSRF